MESIIMSSKPRISIIENIVNPYVRFLVQILIVSFLIFIFYGFAKRLSNIITKYILVKEAISYDTKNFVNNIFFNILFILLFDLACRAV